MKGAAMSLTAVGRFVIFFLTVQVGQSQNGWAVTYNRTQICAVKGSTVTISCSYDYPSGADTQNIWFTKGSDTEPVDLKNDEDYKDRLRYDRRHSKDCTLIIINVRESDTAEYKFGFITNQENVRYVGSPGVTLSVTDPRVRVRQSTRYQISQLSCEVGCELPNHPSFVWYKNEVKMSKNKPCLPVWADVTTDSYSCAIEGYEDFPSPPVCAAGHTCKRVTYTKRSICAPIGSTVDMSCTYHSGNPSITSGLWFRNQQQDDLQAQDLSKDSGDTGRVQISETGQGQSNLRITDLRNSDSAQYRFKFPTPSFERRSSLLGTNLTVTGVSVRITPSAVGPVLQCQTICPLSDATSYVWYKNGQQIDGERSSLYLGTSYSNNVVDSFSCALKGHEDFPSDSVCISGKYCRRVNYNQRRICAPIGSTVDISCKYSGSNDFIKSKFWFRYQQHYHTQPQDLRKDYRYTGRVLVYERRQRQPTLTITDLRESDSAQYRFKFTTPDLEWRSSLPGTTLTVTALQVEVIRLAVEQSQTRVELRCFSSCLPSASLSYVWFINGQKQHRPCTFSYERLSSPGESISCALRGHENHRSPSVYAPKDVLVSSRPSDEIMEGSSVMLTCNSDASPAPNYTFSRSNVNPSLQSVSEGPELFFGSIQSSASGEYYCAAENKLGRTSSQRIFIDVKYPPKSPSILVNSTGDIVEGSSVTLTCTSDANPAAHCTLNKGNQALPLEPGGIYHFTSISPEDRGVYYCTSENTYGQINSSSHFIDVQYSPRLPSVSVSPSGPIVEGSSVTLTCRSDANPAAHYTWYEEEEDSPVASGDVFTIAEFRHKHNRNYYCEAQNSRGHHRSIVHHIALETDASPTQLPQFWKGAMFGAFSIFIIRAVWFVIRRVVIRSSARQRDEIRYERNRYYISN